MADIKTMSADDRECLWLAVMAKQCEAIQSVAVDLDTIAQELRDRIESDEEIIAPGSPKDY